VPGSTRELPYPDIDIEAVRKCVNDRANQSSVREVARRIGVRNTSLTKFLDGSSPYARHRALLCEWYVREAASHAKIAGRSEVDPKILIEYLLGELDGAAREEVRLRIVRAIGDGYRRVGRSEPAWLNTR
jgi:hypothetical protein